MIELNKVMYQKRAYKHMVFFFNVDNTYIGAEKTVGSKTWRFGIWTIDKSEEEFNKNIDYLDDIVVDSVICQETLISFFNYR